MAKKRDPEPAEVLAGLAGQLQMEVALWLRTCEQGCQDPFWPDGSNMNLIRNHVLYYKSEIRAHCEAHRLDLPDAYYIQTPPVVSETYMAAAVMESKDERQRLRISRLRQSGEHLTTKRPVYDPDGGQGALW